MQVFSVKSNLLALPIEQVQMETMGSMAFLDRGLTLETRNCRVPDPRDPFASSGCTKCQRDTRNRLVLGESLNSMEEDLNKKVLKVI